MAEIIAPKFAYTRVGKNGVTGKFHLRDMQSGMSQRTLISVCGRIFDLDDPTVLDASVRELRPENFCKKCLGPLEVR